MYDEAGTTTPSSSFDFGGGGGGDGGYDNVPLPTTAQLNDLGPARVGDSGITTILNNIKSYVSGSPTLSRGIGGLLGSIIGNFFMPGIGSLIGGYLGNKQGLNYSNRYNLNREARTDFLGGKINTSPIYSPPGINKINTPGFTNPNRIPDLNDPFYLDNLYADAKTKAPTSGYDLKQQQKDDVLEQFYQENEDQRPPEQGNLLYGGLTRLV